MSTTLIDYNRNVLDTLLLRGNPVVAYVGPYVAGSYRKGDLVTSGGIFYIADVDTANAPPNADWLPFNQSAGQCVLFLANTNYIIPAAGRYKIEGVGGGGGGGGSQWSSVTDFAAGGGGGSGFYNEFDAYFSNGITLNIVIGSGGSGGIGNQFGGPATGGNNGLSSTVSYTGANSYISSLTFNGGSAAINSGVYASIGGNGYYGGGAGGGTALTPLFPGGSSETNISAGQSSGAGNFVGGSGAFSDSISYPPPGAGEYAVGGSGGGIGSGSPGDPNVSRNGTNALANSGAGGGGASVLNNMSQIGNGGNGGSGWVCITRID